MMHTEYVGYSANQLGMMCNERPDPVSSMRSLVKECIGVNGIELASVNGDGVFAGEGNVVAEV